MANKDAQLFWIPACAGMTSWGPIAGLVWWIGCGIKSVTSQLIVGGGGVKLSMVEGEQVHTGDL